MSRSSIPSARALRAELGGARRTYTHLEGSTRKPEPYDIGTRGLLYYPDRGFEVQTPVAAWVKTYQSFRGLKAEDWERFRDPRATTYASYVATRHRSEIYVTTLLSSIESSDYDTSLATAWVELLERLLPPLRYPAHGLQMVSAYVGSLAPSGTLAVALLLQTADQLRLVQFLAYRMAQLRRTHPAFGDGALGAWQEARMWQPMRRLIEKLLCTYTWDEALVALEFALKPAFDELFLAGLAECSASSGDTVLQKVLMAHYEDGLWHRQCGLALLSSAGGPKMCTIDRSTIDMWLERWTREAWAATSAVAEEIGLQSAMRRVREALDSVQDLLREDHVSAAVADP